MTTIEENIKKLSKVLVAAGQKKYTEQYILDYVTKSIETGDASNKTAALALFKSNPEVKRTLGLGEQQELSFDVLGMRDSESRNDENLLVQEAFIAINRNGKPELRVSSIWYQKNGIGDLKPAPISAGKSYKAKVNLGKDIRVHLPSDENMYLELDKSLFTPETLKQYIALPVEEFSQGSTGMVWGVVGKKDDKKIEISTDGSLLPLNIFPDDNMDVSDIIDGDILIAAGYHGKAGLGARYIARIKEHEPETPKLGKL